MAAERISHSTSSKGCTPAVVFRRSTLSPEAVEPASAPFRTGCLLEEGEDALSAEPAGRGSWFSIARSSAVGCCLAFECCRCVGWFLVPLSGPCERARRSPTGAGARICLWRFRVKNQTQDLV